MNLGGSVGRDKGQWFYLDDEPHWPHHNAIWELLVLGKTLARQESTTSSKLPLLVPGRLFIESGPTWFLIGNPGMYRAICSSALSLDRDSH